MKIIPTIILVFFVNALFSQNPLIKKWDSRFGGSGEDNLFSVVLTFDGGFLLGGHSSSGISGDKTQLNWDASNSTFDYWLVKADASGNKLWDKRFGGINDDQLSCIIQTSDGGYLAGGYSNSDISGDKTQDSRGDYDYWIVKIDSLGNKEWDQRFGGIAFDALLSMQQTSDNGFILGGYSYSSISGDKTQASWGQNDYWIVKTDSLGIIEWDKRFGGNHFDYFFSLKQTSDDGYILAGYSWSGISGDKTQSSRGASDYWLVKINALGNKEWDKRFGGNGADRPNAVLVTAAGGFLIGGFSNSGISGDKSQPTWGGYDFWVIATDSAGTKIWDKNFGGINDEDRFGNIVETTDGYIFTGASYSPLSGDKSENNLGSKQVWLLKTDSAGNKKWDKTILTSGFDNVGYAIPSSDSCLTIATFTNSSIGGEKTQLNWDSTNTTTDYWIIHYCDTTLTTNLLLTLSESDHILIAPNPFSSEISISIQKPSIKQMTISIRDLFGNTIVSKQEQNLAGNYSKAIDLDFLSHGIYLLEVNMDGDRIVRKIVKK